MSAKDDVYRWTVARMVRGSRYERKLKALCAEFKLQPPPKNHYSGWLPEEVLSKNSPLDEQSKLEVFRRAKELERQYLQSHHGDTAEALAVSIWEYQGLLHLRLIAPAVTTPHAKDSIWIYQNVYSIAEQARNLDIPGRPEVPPRDDLTPDRAWKYLENLFAAVYKVACAEEQKAGERAEARRVQRRPPRGASRDERGHPPNAQRRRPAS